MRGNEKSSERYNKTLIKRTIIYPVVFLVATFLIYVAHGIRQIEYPVYTLYVQPETIEEKIAQYDWDVDTAYAVMMAESNASSTVVNWQDNHKGCVGSYGLFQVACIHVEDPEKLKDPDYNIDVAYNIYRESGWSPWGAYNNKSYLTYLY